MDGLNDFIARWRDSSDYVDAHTSGSTGTPKHIRLLKSDMRSSAAATCRFFDIGPSSTVGMALSADYIAGKMMAVRALESGARLAAVAPANTFSLDGIEGTIDLFAIVPSQIANFIARPEYARKVKNLLIGGAAPADGELRRLCELGYRAWISYGMTETCSHVALADAADPQRIFRAMPGIEFAVAADSRLIITAPRYSFGTLATNDVVELLDSRCFRWRGRADGVINSGGIKFFPEELEREYAPFVAGRFYVTRVPDEKWGEAVAVVAEQGSEAEILQNLRAGISDHRRLPKRVFTVGRLPEASNGKIKRLAPEFLNL